MPVLKKASCGAAWPKLGRSVTETFFHVLRKRAHSKSRKTIEEFCQVKGVPEQPTLVFMPLFRSWHKIKCHICPSHCSFYGIVDFGKAWRPKKTWPQVLAPTSLAAVFLELLLQKEDYLRALRALLREIFRALRYEINLQVSLSQCCQIYLCKTYQNGKNIPSEPKIYQMTIKYTK
jgi:hypothetical protein